MHFRNLFDAFSVRDRVFFCGWVVRLCWLLYRRGSITSGWALAVTMDISSLPRDVLQQLRELEEELEEGERATSLRACYEVVRDRNGNVACCTNASLVCGQGLL